MMLVMAPKVNLPRPRVLGAISSPKGDSPDPDARDGRSARWDTHRADRRTELVEAAVTAIEAHGRGAGITEIAKAAGVSKPVLYRYFSDKHDLMSAVGNWAAEQILSTLVTALDTPGPLRDRVQAACGAYLELIQDHQELFFLVLENYANTGDVASAIDNIAVGFTLMLNDDLYQLGLDSSAAEPWAHALIGIGMSTGSWWLQRGTMSRELMSRHMSDFVWNAFAGTARDMGIEVDKLGTLSLLGSNNQETPPPTPIRMTND